MQITYLVGSTALVGTEHDNVGRAVGEFLSVKRLVILEELHVGSTALETICFAISTWPKPNWLVSPTLELDLVLDNEGVVFVVDLLGELRRNGVVSRLVLEHETLVALDTLEHAGLLNRPGADVCPLLLGGLVVLLGVRDLPARFPVVGELFVERCLDGSRLLEIMSARVQRGLADLTSKHRAFESYRQ